MKRSFFFLVSILLSVILYAQKRSVTIDDFKLAESFQKADFSSDGNHIYYTYQNLNTNESVLVYHNLKTGFKRSFPKIIEATFKTKLKYDFWLLSKADSRGYKLTGYQLNNFDSVSFDFVSRYKFSEKANALWFVSGIENQALIRYRFDTRVFDTIISSVQKIASLSFDENQDYLACVIVNHNEESVFIYNDSTRQSFTVDKTHKDFPKGYDLIYNEKSPLKFSLSGKQLFLEIGQRKTLDTRNDDLLIWATHKSIPTEKFFSSINFSSFKQLEYDLLFNTIQTRQIQSSRRTDKVKTFELYYKVKDSSWYAIYHQFRDSINITNGVSAIFYDDQEDLSPAALPLEASTWLSDSTAFIYDKFDIWLVTFGKSPSIICATKRYGVTNQMVLRLAPLYLQSNNNDYLLTFKNENTGEQGFLRLYTKTGLIKKVYSDFAKFQILGKKADRIFFLKESFTIPENLWVSDKEFKNVKQISDINKEFSRSFIRGTIELKSFYNFEGVMLKGLLYKPENFDSTKQYPLIVNFYERNSHRLHDYIYPSYSVGELNPAYFVSNGYLVFIPDIHFIRGSPGPSSYSSVISGINTLIKEGFVDTARIGIQGHSFGGYQSAYIITKSKLFKAAIISAGVVNLTSGYNALRENNSMMRSSYYENGQGRMTKNLWEDWQGYIDNSPMKDMNKVSAPVLMLYNKNDGAVPWSEGLAFFLALKRLGKPGWMLNYKNEGHILQNITNRIDFTKRMIDFFDYYLKGGKQPDWLK